jgi:glycosyltransferase involved in cell wall biosynthesis
VFILPSFYEGLPLVLIEAMACGLRTICTDLTGIRPWLDKALPENGTLFVSPPKMRNTDEPIPESLPDFEKRLARAMDDARQAKLPDAQQVSDLRWDALCEKLIHIFRR